MCFKSTLLEPSSLLLSDVSGCDAYEWTNSTPSSKTHSLTGVKVLRSVRHQQGACMVSPSIFKGASGGERDLRDNLESMARCSSLSAPTFTHCMGEQIPFPSLIIQLPSSCLSSPLLSSPSLLYSFFSLHCSLFIFSSLLLFLLHSSFLFTPHQFSPFLSSFPYPHHG